MADKSKAEKDTDAGEKKYHTGNERMDSTTQTLLVIVVTAIVIFLVWTLQGIFHMDTLHGVIIGTIIVVVAGFLMTWILIRYRKHQIAIDGKSTCDPILNRFAKNHNATKLLAEYDEWRKGNHDPQLVYVFTKATVDALLDTHHYKQARRQLKLMAEMPSSPRAKAEFEQYRQKCQQRMSSGK
ncbi:MAG: hypothetical protein ACOYJL_06350 [Tractidigestivibacter sp.]|jgi:predicted signal transduction protein with EAL and GGDEF domain|uniref:hypothetical protein n=1 Tax=Tractidigestivibacter sp. TaxID=2847320 RepID=UPI003D946448